MTAWDGQHVPVLRQLARSRSARDVSRRPARGLLGRHTEHGPLPTRGRTCRNVRDPTTNGSPGWDGAYSNAAIIGANLDPISGDAPGETPFAAAIFLHRHSYAADGSTRGLSGCVSLSQTDLEYTLRTIDPALNPHFAIGPADYLLTTA